MENIPEFQIGELVYLDSFGGLIPCKIILDWGLTCQVKITANRKGYNKGELVEYTKHWIIKRNKIHIRNGQYVIR